MKCRSCPVWGLEYYKRTGKSLCFCVCHPTTQVNPGDECKYGILDYEDYIRKIEGSEQKKNLTDYLFEKRDV